MKQMKRWLDYWTNEFAECKKKNDFDLCCLVSLAFVIVHATIIGVAFILIFIWIKAPFFASILTIVLGLPIAIAIHIWKEVNEDK